MKSNATLQLPAGVGTQPAIPQDAQQPQLHLNTLFCATGKLQSFPGSDLHENKASMPRKIYKNLDVFGAKRELVKSCIERQEVDEKFKQAMKEGREVVVYGSSKQGKTSLILSHPDHGVLHCRSQAEAGEMCKHLDARLCRVNLKLYPGKTRVVYCKNVRRPGRTEHETLDFLSYTFRLRTARNRYGRLFTAFTSAISRSALSSIRKTVRGWRLQLKNYTLLAASASQIAPLVRSWIGYYGRFRPSELQKVAKHLDRLLTRWGMRKCKRLLARHARACAWFHRTKAVYPDLFAHWSGRGRIRLRQWESGE